MLPPHSSKPIPVLTLTTELLLDDLKVASFSWAVFVGIHTAGLSRHSSCFSFALSPVFKEPARSQTSLEEDHLTGHSPCGRTCEATPNKTRFRHDDEIRIDLQRIWGCLLHTQRLQLHACITTAAAERRWP